MSLPHKQSELTWTEPSPGGPSLLLPEPPLTFGSVPKMGMRRVVTLKEHVQVPEGAHVCVSMCMCAVPGTGQASPACHPSVLPAEPMLTGHPFPASPSAPPCSTQHPALKPVIQTHQESRSQQPAGDCLKQACSPDLGQEATLGA